MRVVILGGTKGIGRALARLCAERDDRVFLLGRGPDDLARSIADLEVRTPGAGAGFARHDLSDWDGAGPALAAAKTALGGVDCVVVTAAGFDTQEGLEADPALAGTILSDNFTGTVLFCEAARRLLLAGGGGTLCVISSVAGDLARKPVVLYGAAKAGLSYYLDGLDVRYRQAGLRTVCIKPGFVRTAMTAGLTPPPFAAEPEVVARGIIRAIEHGAPVAYVPGIWRWIVLVLRFLPRFVRRRLAF